MTPPDLTVQRFSLTQQYTVFTIMPLLRRYVADTAVTMLFVIPRVNLSAQTRASSSVLKPEEGH